MKTKFTFKTERSTGRYKAFYPDTHHIKINKIIVGKITDGVPYKIRLKIEKEPDEKDPCDFAWITLKQESTSLKDAREFITKNTELILSKYKIHIRDNEKDK